MKKKKILLLLVILCFLLTGCSKNLKDKDNKIVKNEVTGQNLVANILCQPTAKSTIEKYVENKVEIKKLPECKNYKVTDGGYEGIWTTIFVKPLAWFVLKIGYLVKNFGLAVILATLLIRLLLMPFTKKAAMQSENMKLIKPEMDKLEKKYAGKNDNNSMVMKAQEMSLLYKKYNISPAAGCLFSFIQLPLFLAFYEALYRLPAVFEGKFLFYDLGVTPLIAISAGKWYYLILVVLVFAVTYFSFKLNVGASMGPEQEKQMKTMRNISLVMIGTASLSVSTAIALYWITNSSFTILQNLYVKYVKKGDKKNDRRK